MNKLVPLGNNHFRQAVHVTLLALLAAPLFAGNNNNIAYLALGDSVAYGLNVNLLVDNPPPTPNDFVGYPEVIAEAEHWLQSSKLDNTSCPGETSTSFITGIGPDYGCYSNGPQGQPPFKSWIGLHTPYTGSQLAFATSQLASDKHIQLVTLGIGTNDVLLLLAQCNNNPACFEPLLPGVLNTYGQNLAYILKDLRANFNGPIVLALTYSPSPSLNSLAQALNGVTLQVGAQFGAKFADGYDAFQLASAPFGGDPCQAGLLIKLTGTTTCDIHPSPIGQDLLAATVFGALIGVPLN